MAQSKPIKVLQVTGGMNRAGTETMLMNIYRNIDHDKIQFDFISYSRKEAHYDKEIEMLGGRVIRLNQTNSVKELYQVMKNYGPYQAVHSHTLFHCGIANMAALLAGVKVRIAHAHTTDDEHTRLIKKLYISGMRKVIKYASTNYLACSKQSGNYLFGKQMLEKNEYSYFPNVIDYFSLIEKPQQKVNEFKLQHGLGNSLVIGHIGRFIEAKNHTFLLKIMKVIVNKHQDAKLLLVGDGDLRSQLIEEAEELGIFNNIRFVGVRSDIETMLHSMDVFVFPSIYEGLGLVLLEAQASGTQCVVSNAIQPEADLGLELVSNLSLSDGPEKWAEVILEKAGQKEKNINKIINSFELNRYSLNAGISRLLKIYGGKQGENYEKPVNYLL
ncbi:glycosyltransferase family 1 protein [Halobacillus sp. A5]|uniref:glycosyltransferase family 1 protein n=1 Tax=Halobacillus sp. A5 TaxID=2880263 RepID=UPI0020A6356B|nr:glycosyltransferase family 1 protein [Halobacillus sp. A5]